jgi:hypothetical protein
VSFTSAPVCEAEVPFFHRRFHQLADGFEDNLEFLVVLAELVFELFQLAGKVFVGGQQLAQADEGAHDGDVDLDGAAAAQDAGEHGDAQLGKGERPVFRMPTAAEL